MKRFFDLTLLTLSLPIWLSVIAIFYLVNILIEGFPGFYKSERYIGNNKFIKIIKFRVMKKNIDKTLNRTSITDDSQIFLNLPQDSSIYTNFGLIIEKFGITELPQFLSVLKGDMSIVGSRPLPYDVYKALQDNFPDLAVKRFKVGAGIAGLPQLIGRELLTDIDRLNLEVAYAEWTNKKYNFMVDLKIIFFTILFVLNLRKKMNVEQALSLLQ
tara:strand:- start:6282 stop:6923 length:642 start_codon:yes stop_codon:yes gene_type:complete